MWFFIDACNSNIVLIGISMYFLATECLTLIPDIADTCYASLKLWEMFFFDLIRCSFCLIRTSIFNNCLWGTELSLTLQPDLTASLTSDFKIKTGKFTVFSLFSFYSPSIIRTSVALKNDAEKSEMTILKFIWNQSELVLFVFVKWKWYLWGHL